MAEDVNSHNPAVVTFSKDDVRDAPYTNTLLSHAHPEASFPLFLSVRLCSARLFIGPIPQGWIKTHKRTWYGTKKKYTNRAITFTAPAGQSNTRSTGGLDGSEAAMETVSSTSEQVISQSASRYLVTTFPFVSVAVVDSSVPTSLQFTSDSGTSSSGVPAEQRRQSELDRVVTSPVVSFLSPKKKREEKDDLDRLDKVRNDREIEQGEMVDLEPVPSQDELRQQRRRAAGGVTDGRVSDEHRPLLRNLSDDTGGGRESYVESIDT